MSPHTCKPSLRSLHPQRGRGLSECHPRSPRQDPNRFCKGLQRGRGLSECHLRSPRQNRSRFCKGLQRGRGLSECHPRSLRQDRSRFCKGLQRGICKGLQRGRGLSECHLRSPPSEPQSVLQRPPTGEEARAPGPHPCLPAGGLRKVSRGREETGGKGRRSSWFPLPDYATLRSAGGPNQSAGTRAAIQEECRGLSLSQDRRRFAYSGKTQHLDQPHVEREMGRPHPPYPPECRA